MKKISLPKNKFALVDDEDYSFLMQWRWFYHPSGSVMRLKVIQSNPRKRKIFRMHREILNPPKNRSVDHIDGNSLNNQKYNLRVCKHGENLRNQKKQKNTSSKYKGVCWFKRDSKWVSKIKVNQKTINLGRFDADKEIEAAKAYDAAALKHFGEFANLNFPKDKTP